MKKDNHSSPLCVFATQLQNYCCNFAVLILKKLFATMKKSYKIEVDCANCANLVENEVKKVEGVTSATISFMTQKMKIEFAEGADVEAVMAQIIKVAKKIEPDFEVLS